MKNILATNGGKIDDEYVTLYDILEEGKRLFIEELFFEGYSLIRENTDRSQLTNEEIHLFLRGEATAIFSNFDIVDIIFRPEPTQFLKVNDLKEKYKNLLKIDNQCFNTLKTIDFDFFDSISPRKFQENLLFSTSLLKQFMFDIKGEYFIIKDNKVFFVEKKDIKGYHPFL